MRARLDLAVNDLGPTQLKNIAEPVRVYSLEVGVPVQAKPAPPADPPPRSHRCRWRFPTSHRLPCFPLTI